MEIQSKQDYLGTYRFIVPVNFRQLLTVSIQERENILSDEGYVWVPIYVLAILTIADTSFPKLFSDLNLRIV